MGEATVLSKEELDQIVTRLMKRLEAIREAKGMSKERFANAVLGISSPTYYRWLEGDLVKVSIQRLQELEALADRLEAELEEEG